MNDHYIPVASLDVCAYRMSVLWRMTRDAKRKGGGKSAAAEGRRRHGRPKTRFGGVVGVTGVQAWRGRSSAPSSVSLTRRRKRVRSQLIFLSRDSSSVSIVTFDSFYRGTEQLRRSVDRLVRDRKATLLYFEDCAWNEQCALTLQNNFVRCLCH